MAPSTPESGTSSTQDVADGGGRAAALRSTLGTLGTLGALLVVAIVGAALFAPWVMPFDPAAQELPLRLAGPSAGHWFGLDELGRDILSRVLLGARVSLFVGLVVVGVSATVGMAMGAIAG
jgi:peptide/nickel transport system permease protein